MENGRPPRQVALVAFPEVLSDTPLGWSTTGWGPVPPTQGRKGRKRAYLDAAVRWPARGNFPAVTEAHVISGIFVYGHHSEAASRLARLGAQFFIMRLFCTVVAIDPGAGSSGCPPQVIRL